MVLRPERNRAEWATKRSLRQTGTENNNINKTQVLKISKGKETVVPAMIAEERALIITRYKKRQRDWIEYMFREDSLLKTVFKGKLERKKP